VQGESFETHKPKRSKKLSTLLLDILLKDNVFNRVTAHDRDSDHSADHTAELLFIHKLAMEHQLSIRMETGKW
jgi:hypothetical protein